VAVSHSSDHIVSCPHGSLSVSALISGNFQTREELRDALDSEIRTFSSDRDLAGNALIAWNHHEFEVQYQCLAEEVRIGDYYLRLRSTSALRKKCALVTITCGSSWRKKTVLTHRYAGRMSSLMTCTTGFC